MKQKMLIIGITMAAAGSEKSFLSFASHAIDYEKYEVDLLLAKKEGEFLSLVPKEIRVLEMGEAGDLFLLNRKNAGKIIAKQYLFKNPLRAFALLPYIVARATARSDRKKTFISNWMWIRMMRSLPSFSCEYDVALAYWGDRTMFYMVDKVKAKKKIAWLHFDYAHPPREDAVYLDYFQKCDRVVTVSAEIERSLRTSLPTISERVVLLENIVDRNEILKAASEFADFEDDFEGVRLLTVGRICEQKGYDLALSALARLVKEGYSFKWYIIGGGEKQEILALLDMIRDLDMEDSVSYLGVRKNPYPFMRAADIYLQPSRHEGKPIAVEEAKMLCKPIFLTNYTSAMEQTEGGTLGVVGEISESGIYFGIKKLLDEADLRTELQKRLSIWSKHASDIPQDLAILE